jgi:hypothetical protein
MSMDEKSWQVWIRSAEKMIPVLTISNKTLGTYGIGVTYKTRGSVG